MNHADLELAHDLKLLYDPIQSAYSKVRCIDNAVEFTQKRLQVPQNAFRLIETKQIYQHDPKVFMRFDIR